MHHRELLGDLARLAYETLHELMGRELGGLVSDDDVDPRPDELAPEWMPHGQLAPVVS